MICFVSAGFYGVKYEYNNIIKSLFTEISQIYKVKIDLDNFYHIHLLKYNNAYIFCAHTLEYVINKNIIQRDKIFTHNILGYIDKDKIFFCKPDVKYNTLFNSYSYSIEYEKLGAHFMDINLYNDIIHIAPIIYNQV